MHSRASVAPLTDDETRWYHGPNIAARTTSGVAAVWQALGHTCTSGSRCCSGEQRC
jgi:hypothetical protein